MSRGGLGRSEGAILKSELVAHLRASDRAELARLRAKIINAQIARRNATRDARETCASARVALQTLQRAQRVALREAQQSARENRRSTCSANVAAARDAQGERGAREALRAARVLQGQVRRADKGTAPRSTRRERAAESDDAVRRNLPAELVPVFNQRARQVRGSNRRSRTEEFLEWAAENPEDIGAAHTERVDRELADLLAAHAKQEKQMRSARRYRGTHDELRASLEAVPF